LITRIENSPETASIQSLSVPISKVKKGEDQIKQSGKLFVFVIHFPMPPG